MIKITNELISDLILKAKHSERRRTIYNFHQEYSDPVNRMLNVMEPNTYVQPHKHENPDKREIFLILTGRAVIIQFDDNGKINDYIILDRNNNCFGVEISPGQWHTIIALSTGTAFYEVKDGPYDEKTDKTFADWAPDENDRESMKYNQNLLKTIGILKE